LLQNLLRENEAAEVLRLSERTLERWRSRGEGPKAKKIGARRVAYPPPSRFGRSGRRRG
jgi:predicted DNA-binding transcriptional regulator AlpA